MKTVFFIALASVFAWGAVMPGRRSFRLARAAEPRAGTQRPQRKDDTPAPPMNTAKKTSEKSYRGPLAELTAEQVRLRDALRADLEQLAGKIGERNLQHYRELQAAAEFISQAFAAAGYKVNRQTYPVEGRNCDNLEVDLPGAEKKDEIVIVGAHYDSVFGSPGANDNGSGVVSMLALARRFAGKQPGRTLRFVAFVNEEPPYFQQNSMGSVVYARRCRTRKENIVAAISLETMGYYNDKPGSQRYPPALRLLFPSSGDFIGFVANLRSRPLLDEFTSSFRGQVKFPSEKAALPEFMEGVGWSDHWSFWQQEYPGLMVTDTAHFRYPFYHTKDDTPDKIDYDRLARVVDGLTSAVADLARISDKSTAAEKQDDDEPKE